MTFKELREKYKGYNIHESGYPNGPLFACLPKRLRYLRGKEYMKASNNYEVAKYEVIEKPHVCIDITHLVVGGKKRSNSHYKGTVTAYYFKDYEDYRKNYDR